MEISQLNGNTLVDATFHEYINTVGAVIFSFDNSFSPSALWGGSWSRVTDRFLIGSGGTYTTGGTGGETNVALAVNQIPGHSHVQKLAVFGIGQPIMVEGPQSEDGYQVASQGAQSANGTPVQTETRAVVRHTITCRHISVAIFGEKSHKETTWIREFLTKTKRRSLKSTISPQGNW